MNSERARTRAFGPASVCATGTALFAAAMDMAAAFLLEAAPQDVYGFGQGVLLPLAALVAAIHLMLFLAFRAVLGPKSPSSGWRLGMALALSLGLFQTCAAFAVSINAIFGMPWALRLLFAGLSALCGIAAFAVLGTPARRRVFAVFSIFLVAAVVCGAAYLASMHVMRRDSVAETGGLAPEREDQEPPDESFDTRPSDFVSSEHTIPRVILITIDSLRQDALGCYAENQNSPNIDAFAGTAVLFENAVTPSPWTLPSLASMNTGVSPGVHQAVHSDGRLPDAFDTLAERMSGAGYLTGAIVANVFLEEERGFAQGFHHYRNIPVSEGTTDRITSQAEQWIDANAGQDFFLWLHYFDPHQPYLPPDEFAPDSPVAERFRKSFPSVFRVRAGSEKFGAEEMAALRDLYDAEVRYVDDRVGRILDQLRERNLFEDALIIITSDHGEEFWDHGGYEHGHTLYNELVKIPMLIRLPGGKMGGSRVSPRVSLTAVCPTILDLCAIYRIHRDFSEHSLASFIEGLIPKVDEPLKIAYPMIYEPKQCVFLDNHKYIHNLSSDREELYDLVEDPGEQMNIASRIPRLVERARELLQTIDEEEENLRARLGVEDAETITIEPESAQGLRDLGYL